MRRLSHLFGLLIGLALAAPPGLAKGGVDATTLDHKLIFGFQGWFGCPGDGGALDRWNHWFRDNRPGPTTATTDLLPDVSPLPAAERCETSLVARSGKPIEVFSDQRASTVLWQFEAMRDHKLDGVALQRFVISLGGDSRHAFADRVLQNVRSAAERTGRVFFIQYDIAGADAGDWDKRILDDWLALLRDQHIGDSPAYLHHRGHLLLGVTGLGMKGPRPATPARTLQLLKALREESRPYGGVTLFGTVPRAWRTLDRDSLTDPAWAEAYRAYDVISPWLVGSYHTDAEIQRHVTETLIPDLSETRRLGIDYMPVIFPGFSWANLKKQPELSNQYPRRCGFFLWAQATQFQRAGITMLFGAMFDEVDEGTAWFPTIRHAADLPESPAYVSLDADNCDLPSDYFLQVGTQIQRLLSGRPARLPRLQN